MRFKVAYGKEINFFVCYASNTDLQRNVTLLQRGNAAMCCTVFAFISEIMEK